MNHLNLKKFLLFIFIVSFPVVICNAQISNVPPSKSPDRAPSGHSKSKKIKGPVSVRKAQRAQEKNEKRLKKEYAEAIEKSRQRTYNIQSPEVQARMKENNKDTKLREKEKKKNRKTSSRKAGRKYT